MTIVVVIVYPTIAPTQLLTTMTTTRGNCPFPNTSYQQIHSQLMHFNYIL